MRVEYAKSSGFTDSEAAIVLVEPNVQVLRRAAHDDTSSGLQASNEGKRFNFQAPVGVGTCFGQGIVSADDVVVDQMSLSLLKCKKGRHHEPLVSEDWDSASVDGH